MSTMKDVGDRIARFRAESPDFEDGSYSGATVFDFLDELQDRLEALAQPPHGGVVAWLRHTPDGVPDWAEDCIAQDDHFLDSDLEHEGYTLRPLIYGDTHPQATGLSADECEALEHVEAYVRSVFDGPLKPDVALLCALIRRLAAPPVVVSEPDSPASIRASLEGIEPVGAGDGPLAMAWIRRAYNGTGPFTIWSMEVAHIAGYNAALATAPAANPQPVAYAAGLEANMRGFIDVMAWREGEFTIPLYTKAPALIDDAAVKRAQIAYRDEERRRFNQRAAEPTAVLMRAALEAALARKVSGE